MTLRRKTLLIFGLTLASLIGALWALARTVLVTGFANVEEQVVRRRMAQVQTLAAGELVSLGTANEDYAYWDETYAFMKTRDLAYLRYLPDADKTSLRVQLLALLDPSRKLVFGKELDLERKADRPLPAFWQEAFASGRVALSAEGETTGLVVLAQGPVLLTVRPILTTSRQGPSRGFFVYGRYLDPWQLSKLSRDANLPLVLRGRDDPDLPTGLLSSGADSVLVAPRDESTLQAYVALTDVTGRPGLVLSAELPRPVYEQARASLARLTWLVLVVGLTVGGVGLLLFERLTVSRLRRLSSAVEGIGRAGDLSARLHLPGDDELSGLAAALNRMLDTLAGSQQRLLESEGQLRQAQKMEAVGSLAGGVAHDFNNLLGVITGFGELLSRDLGPAHPGQRRLEQIRKAAESAAALTRQLLAFGRKQTLRPTVLDLNSVLTHIDKMLRRLIGEDVQLVTVLETQLGRVKADSGQIEQVLLNLAVNARDAMPQGGRLVFETSNASLDAKTAPPGAAPGAYVVLTVSDTGRGMDEATKARIFEPFFTTKEMGKGTGLGLSTVFGIVKQSEGHIDVESAPGKGSMFHIYLPRVPDAAPGLPEPDRPEAVAGGWETVLLAEDEAPLRAMVEEILKAGGYSVLAVPSPQAALALAATHVGPLHLLLTDVVMPQMSGREMATHLLVLRPEVRVLYMSGYTDEAMGHHGILGTDVCFLQKPFEPDELLRRVRAVLDAPAA